MYKWIHIIRYARMPRQQHFVFRKKTNTTHPHSYNDFIVCFAKFFFTVNNSKIKGTRLRMSPSLSCICHYWFLKCMHKVVRFTKDQILTMKNKTEFADSKIHHFILLIRRTRFYFCAWRAGATEDILLFTTTEEKKKQKHIAVRC